MATDTDSNAVLTKPALHPKPAEGEPIAGTPYCCEWLRRLTCRYFYKDTVASLIGGDLYVPKLAHLAIYFGVGLATVKAWRAMGMPGRTAKGYSLLDVLEWRMVADAEASGRQMTVFACPTCDARRRAAAS